MAADHKHGSSAAALVKGLGGPGFCILDGFLGAARALSLRGALERSQRSGDMKPGKVGPADEVSVETALRTDLTLCVRPGWNDVIDIMVDKQRELIDAAMGDLPELRGGLSGPLGPAAVQCAVYPGGGSCYKRHVDNPGSDEGDRRLLSMVYYCTQGWQPADGGCLRLHWADGCGLASAKKRAFAAAALGVPEASLDHRLQDVFDVEPFEDRLVVFWADYRMPHEVLPSKGQRFAVSTWWASPPSPSEANSLYAARCIPQRLALKYTELRPELLETLKKVSVSLEKNLPARVPAFLSHGLCPLSQKFGKEATLPPNGLRDGVVSLAALKPKPPRRLEAPKTAAHGGNAASGAPPSEPTSVNRMVLHSFSAEAYGPLITEFMGVLDKLAYMLGSQQAEASPLARLGTGGRTRPCLANAVALPDLSPVAAGRMPGAQYLAVFFLWGSSGWTIVFKDHTGNKRSVRVAAGDMFLFPLGTGEFEPTLVLKPSSAFGGQQGSADVCRWVEVWYFGAAELPTEVDGSRFSAIKETERKFIEGTPDDDSAHAGEAHAAAKAAISPCPYWWEGNGDTVLVVDLANLAAQATALGRPAPPAGLSLDVALDAVRLCALGEQWLSLPLPKTAALEVDTGPAQYSRRRQQLRVPIRWAQDR